MTRITYGQIRVRTNFRNAISIFSANFLADARDAAFVVISLTRATSRDRREKLAKTVRDLRDVYARKFRKTVHDKENEAERRAACRSSRRFYETCTSITPNIVNPPPPLPTLPFLAVSRLFSSSALTNNTAVKATVQLI